MIKLKGNTAEEKLVHVERILDRFSRKLHKTVIGVMPPVPVMFSTSKPKKNGEIFNFLVPVKGIITDVCLYVKKFDGSEAISFKVYTEGPSAGSYANFMTKKNLTVYKVDLTVYPGDLLKLKTNSPEKVHGIWLAFLYQMGISDCGKETFLIDEWEKLLEEKNYG